MSVPRLERHRRPFEVPRGSGGFDEVANQAFYRDAGDQSFRGNSVPLDSPIPSKSIVVVEFRRIAISPREEHQRRISSRSVSVASRWSSRCGTSRKAAAERSTIYVPHDDRAHVVRVLQGAMRARARRRITPGRSCDMTPPDLLQRRHRHLRSTIPPTQPVKSRIRIRRPIDLREGRSSR